MYLLIAYSALVVGCPASTISLDRRQLFLRINYNYFLTLRLRAAPALGRRAKPARRPCCLS